MRVVEQIAKTVEEATALALQKLGVDSPEKVEVEVLDEGSKGVFGWGTKYARVRARIKDGFVEKIGETLQEMLRLMQADAAVEKGKDGEEGQQHYNIYGPELGFLIGKRGQTLEALQFILNLMTNRGNEEKIKIILDVEGYRLRREKQLVDLAGKIADQVRREKRNVVLEPMLPGERRIIHLALKDHPVVTTYSEGQEPLRKVIIAPRKDVPKPQEKKEELELLSQEQHEQEADPPSF